MNQNSAMVIGRILLVDDNPMNLAVLEELLKDDYETMSAKSGEEAKSLAVEFKPDLVMLDVMMPGIDGYEVLRWIRFHPELKAIKVFMVSARASMADVEQGLALGADEYVTKPFDIRQLGKTIREQLTSVSPVDLRK
ncbi:MAG: response regulator [Gammaproteobacteria bacterium]|nr:response regulator [Gammaproteobacteria bacterium]